MSRPFLEPTRPRIPHALSPESKFHAWSLTSITPYIFIVWSLCEHSGGKEREVTSPAGIRTPVVQSNLLAER